MRREISRRRTRPPTTPPTIAAVGVEPFVLACGAATVVEVDVVDGDGADGFEANEAKEGLYKM
jgi:hypothetical protein